MGTFSVKVTLSHPEQRANQVTLDLLVDTGTTSSLVPAGVAQSAGVKPTETRSVKTADGRRLDLPLAEIRFTIDGRSLTTPCLVGAPDAPALLGTVTLEAFGLAADPVQKALVPVTGLLLCASGATRGRGTRGASRADAPRPAAGSIVNPGSRSSLETREA